MSLRLVGVLQVPPYFHPAADWATLVAQGVIDGAIVSSLCHDQALPANRLPRWPGTGVSGLERPSRAWQDPKVMLFSRY